MIEETDPALTVPVFDVWRCIGCGRIEAPQPCIGVCEDRKARMIEFRDYEALLSRFDDAAEAVSKLETVLRRIALTRPRAGEWERSYLALQEDARRALGGLAGAREPKTPTTPAAPSADEP